MSITPTCQAADFFVLRTPSLPLDALGSSEPEPGAAGLEASRERSRSLLRALLRDGAVREAVALASPDLAARLDLWLEGLLEADAAMRVERALLRYLIRMSRRATPFGLFAGVSTGTWGASSHLSVSPWLASRKAVRLDWGAMERLVDHLTQDPDIRAALSYRPNSSLHACGGWYRYLERRDHSGQERGYHLEAVEATPHLDFVLQAAADGIGLEDLATRLAAFAKVKVEVAKAYLDRLVETQVLCGDLQPALTSGDPLGHLARKLSGSPFMHAGSDGLAALESELNALRASPVGAHPSGYGRLLPSLTRLGLSADRRDVIQVDLFRSAPDLALSSAVQRALEQGAETLRRLTPPPKEGALDRFRAAFRDRYESRWVRLLDVLDEESGIGFDGAPVAEGTLLEDLPLSGAGSSPEVTPRDQYLLSQVVRWCTAPVWELTDADVAALASPDPQPFPASFAALATLSAASVEALDRGDFTFCMEQYSGPTAARWLGRFASGDPALEGSLRRHLQREEATRPEAVFAEVVHVPEGRMGNVLARPALRDHEIPFLSAAGAAPDQVIQPADLLVTVRGDRVHLVSARTGLEVIPRLASAHNFLRGPAVYRFLAHLQDQDGRPGGWSWGILADQPYLPRLVRGRHVLAKARWRIEAAELKQALQDTAEGPMGAFQLLRARRGLPRHVVLADADNLLPIDLDQTLWVETLHQLVARRPVFVLTESYPAQDEALVTSPDGRFAHELVIPFEAAATPRVDPRPLPPSVETEEPRAYPPGSSWLYLKLYCGATTADRLLVELEPLLRVTGKQGLWDRWHFVRYRDPSPHLRIRFHGLPFRLLAEMLPLLRKHLEGYLAQGLLWKWQVDTFEPELERYGGAVGFQLAEAWFFEDSQHVLHQLMTGLDQEKRWRAGLRAVDAIWAALGLGIPERRDLARTARDGFRKEFRATGQDGSPIGAKFRRLRKELEAGFPYPAGASSLPNLSGLSRLRAACEEGLVQGELAAIAGSLAHMHLNRLLRADHRAIEWVLMEFLTRLYESELARVSYVDRNPIQRLVAG
ncbi:MAG TPA: lantibiotic dehydratase [Geothrix sp.]|nr:lantibiotic dehydratase [Geothrix sp.]